MAGAFPNGTANGTPSVHSNGAALAGHKRVFMTLITKKSYLPGLLTLDYALKKVKSKYPLVAMYTSTLEPEAHQALDARGILKRRSDELLPSVDDIDYGNDPRFRDTWSKLAVFGLVEFDRVVLLDSDMLIRQNLDELMDVELDPASSRGEGNKVFAACHACTCNPMKKPHYPKDWVPSSCGFSSQHSNPDAAQTQGASNTLSHNMPNSGLLVVNPARELYEAVLGQLKNEAAVRSYTFPDQGVLVDLFARRWVPLPYVYNGLKTMRKPTVHGAIWRDDCVKIVHYIFSPKPWNERREDVTEEPVLWWLDENEARQRDEKAVGISDGH